MNLGDDPAAYLVYADSLIEKGDPQGELIIAQVNGDEPRARAILREHRKHLLGGLHDGFTPTWRWGFLDEAHFARGSSTFLDPGAAIRTLFALPAAQRLRALEIGDSGREDPDFVVDVFADHSELVQAITEVEIPPTLRRLAFLAERWPIEMTTIGDLGPALEHLPALEELVVCGSEIDFGSARCPNVRRLELWTGAEEHLLEAVLDPARFGALEALAVSAYAIETYGDRLRARFGAGFSLRER